MGQKKVLFAEPFRELGGSRTHNRLIRSQGLYPIELLVQSFFDTAKVQLFSFTQANIREKISSFSQPIDLQTNNFIAQAAFLRFSDMVSGKFLYLPPSTSKLFIP